MDDVIELDASSPILPQSHRDRDRSRSPVRPTNNTIIIINIPYDVTWKDLKDVIRTKVKDYIKFFVSMYMIDDRPIGVAIIEAHNLNDTELILNAMDGYSMSGRTLVARFERPNDHPRYMDKGAVLEGFRKNRPSPAMRPPPEHKPSYNKIHDERNFYAEITDDIKSQGISYELLDRLEIKPGEINNKIYVGNLSYEIDEEKLREVFSLAGNLTSVCLRNTADGKSRGFGTITYELELHAIQAISMFNGQILNNRQMRVRMDRIIDNKAPQSQLKLPDGLSSIGDGLGIMGKIAKDASSVKPEVLKINYDQHGNGFSNGSMIPPSERGGGGGGGDESSPYPVPRELNNRSLDSIMRNLENSDRNLRSRNSDQFGRVLEALTRNIELPKVHYDDYSQSDMPARGGYNDSYKDSRMSGGGDGPRGYNGSQYQSHSPMRGGGGGGGYESSRRSYGDRNDNHHSRASMEGRGERGRPYDRTPMRREKDLQPNVRDRLQIDSKNSSKKVHHSQESNISDAHKFQTGDDSIIVTNLPMNITWLDLRSKFREVGSVRYAEISKGNAKRGVVRFTLPEDAEKAVDQLNKTSYHGETILVCPERDAK